MAQDQRIGDNGISDPSVVVIVKVGSANPDREDFEKDLARAGRWAIFVVKLKCSRSMKT
jgi:hypothetical protein